MGRPQCDKVMGSLQPAQPLQIVAQHNSTHTESYKIQRLILCKCPPDKISDLGSQHFQPHLPIAGHKSDGVRPEILLCEKGGEVAENRCVIPIARNQYHWIGCIWLIVHRVDCHS